MLRETVWEKIKEIGDRQPESPPDGDPPPFPDLAGVTSDLRPLLGWLANSVELLNLAQAHLQALEAQLDIEGTAGLYWFVLVCTGLYWGYTGLYWFILGRAPGAVLGSDRVVLGLFWGFLVESGRISVFWGESPGFWGEFPGFRGCSRGLGSDPHFGVNSGVLGPCPELEKDLESCDEALGVLDEVIMSTFQQSVYYLTKTLYSALPALLDTNPFVGAGEPRAGPDLGGVPEGLRPPLAVFRAVLGLTRDCRLHPELASQTFGYLFFFSNASLFNTLMEKGSAGPFFQWWVGVRLRTNLDLVLDGLGALGLGDIAGDFFRKLSATANLLCTPRGCLEQVSAPGHLGTAGYTWAHLGTAGYTWAHLGTAGYKLGTPGHSWDTPGIHLGTPGYSWVQAGYTWVQLGTAGYKLGTPGHSWDTPGIHLGTPGHTWAHLGYTWAHLGYTWAHLGTPGHTWAHLGYTWAHLGTAGIHLGTPGDIPGLHLGTPGDIPGIHLGTPGYTWAHLGTPGIYLGTAGYT
uniref:Uncharacterized protein n=1 Tax=Geospiza parvula TaxID=87175 RepID=A0A8C3MP30_GEOPR